jgi:hypothetical protein
MLCSFEQALEFAKDYGDRYGAPGFFIAESRAEKYPGYTFIAFDGPDQKQLSIPVATWSNGQEFITVAIGVVARYVRHNGCWLREDLEGGQDA